MKLFYSPTSPYVRKVLACAIARGIEKQIEKIPTNPHESPSALVAEAPLSKIPCLLTNDGTALYDSPVICEYLDTVGDQMAMFPASGAARWRALRTQALADGIMDAAILHVMESKRPQDDARSKVIERQKTVVERSLAVLESDPPHDRLDIGSIAVGCALGYLDLRFPQSDWRGTHPKLKAWFQKFAELPCMKETAPPAA